MPLTIKLGASQWDAVAYVRNQIEDTGAVQLVSDAALQAYAEDALEAFAERVAPQWVIGSPFASPPSSPLQTVAAQAQYVLVQGSVGMPNVPILGITDVSWRAIDTLSAVSEWSYMYLLPAAPLTQFLPSPDLIDSPSLRVQAEMRRFELDQYGTGFWERYIDPVTGSWAIRLYPAPTAAGQPIFVKVRLGLNMTPPDGQQVMTIPACPEVHKVRFAKLLLATVQYQEADRLAKYKTQRGGITDIAGDANAIRRLAELTKNTVFLELGDGASVARRTT